MIWTPQLAETMVCFVSSFCNCSTYRMLQYGVTFYRITTKSDCAYRLIVITNQHFLCVMLPWKQTILSVSFYCAAKSIQVSIVSGQFFLNTSRHNQGENRERAHCWKTRNTYLFYIRNSGHHYYDVIMDAIASQITSLTIVYSTVYSDADQSKHQSSASLAFVRGIHRGPVNSPHKWPVTRKMFPFDEVIMIHWGTLAHTLPQWIGSSLVQVMFGAKPLPKPKLNQWKQVKSIYWKASKSFETFSNGIPKGSLFAVNVVLWNHKKSAVVQWLKTKDDTFHVYIS